MPALLNCLDAGLYGTGACRACRESLPHEVSVGVGVTVGQMHHITVMGQGEVEGKGVLGGTLPADHRALMVCNPTAYPKPSPALPQNRTSVYIIDMKPVHISVLYLVSSLNVAHDRTLQWRLEAAGIDEDVIHNQLQQAMQGGHRQR